MKMENDGLAAKKQRFECDMEAIYRGDCMRNYLYRGNERISETIIETMRASGRAMDKYMDVILP